MHKQILYVIIALLIGWNTSQAYAQSYGWIGVVASNQGYTMVMYEDTRSYCYLARYETYAMWCFQK